MTVEKVDGPAVTCVYFDGDGVFERRTGPRDMLTLADAGAGDWHYDDTSLASSLRARLDDELWRKCSRKVG